MIGRRQKSKEKKYQEDETDNDNINLKDSPKLIKVLKYGREVTFYPEKFVKDGTLFKINELVELKNGRDRENRFFARVFRTVYFLNLLVRT